MRIYLDNSSIQRPLDTRDQARIVLEADAVIMLLAAVDGGTVEIVDSDILRFEISKSPNFYRRIAAVEVPRRTKLFVSLNDRIVQRARKFLESGLKPLDALHLASAEQCDSQFFCTCDDGILKKRETLSDCTTRIVSPVELVQELQL